MSTIEAIILGIIQGLSEFLPISSSAHIVFTANIYAVLTGSSLDVTSQHIFLSIMLHVGTLIAVMIYFWKELWTITKSFLKALYKRDFSDENAMFGVYILVGTIFTVAIAYPLNDISENLLGNPIIVAMLLILTGFVLFFSEFKSKHLEKNTQNLDLKKAIIIGLAQGLAGFPGLSRSGWTIAAGLFLGMNRVKSTRFSFLLIVPIIIGASIFYPILEIKPSEFASYNWLGITLGTITSAVVGYFCIKYFLKFVARFTMNFFAYYCIIAGLLVITFFTVLYYGSNMS